MNVFCITFLTSFLFFHVYLLYIFPLQHYFYIYDYHQVQQLLKTWEQSIWVKSSDCSQVTVTAKTQKQLAAAWEVHWRPKADAIGGISRSKDGRNEDRKPQLLAPLANSCSRHCFGSLWMTELALGLEFGVRLAFGLSTWAGCPPWWFSQEEGKGKGKGKRSIPVSNTPHRLGNSYVTWDHTVMGVRKSIRPVKIEWWGVGVVIWLYGLAGATASPKTHRLLPHLNPDWFYLSGNGLPKLSLKRGR